MDKHQRVLLDPGMGESGGGGSAPSVTVSTAAQPTYPSSPSPGPSAADTQSVSVGLGTPTGEPGAGAGVPPATGGGLPGSPSQSAGGMGAPAPSALRAQLVQAGYQVPETMSDGQIVDSVLQLQRQSEQSRYYAQLGQAMYPHYGRFREWMDGQGGQQGQQGAAPQQQPAGPWAPPQFDTRWMSVVEQDPNTGQYRSKAGYDPAFGTQVQQYDDYLREGNRLALTDPPQWIERYGSGMVQQLVQQAIQQHFGTYRNEVQAQQIIASNAQWLYNRDQGGGVVIDPSTGTPQLSAEGVRFYRHVEYAAKQLRLGDINQQREYAMNMLELDRMRAGQRSAQAAAPQVPAGAGHSPQWNQLQAQAATDPSRAGVQPTALPAATPGALSLTEMMRQGMRQAGVTDDQLRMEATYGGY